MSAIADETLHALRPLAWTTEPSLRAAHELLALVRPCFRLVPRPSGRLVAAPRCCVACCLPAVAASCANHREFEGMIREHRVGFGCLACLGREGYVYYAQSVLAYFLGSLIAGCCEQEGQRVYALRWMEVFVPPSGAAREFRHRHIPVFSGPQRFLVASTLQLASVCQHGTDRSRAGELEACAHGWHAL